MDGQSGVYVLLMHLPAAKQLAIGALGKQAFASGWYAYVGSAHGPGGLRSRTARHKTHGFGSQDCREGCGAHLLHFNRRPFAAVLRHGLLQRHPSDPRLCVEFVEQSGSLANDADRAVPLMENYLRGSRYLELRRSNRDGEARYGKLPAACGTDPMGRQVVSRLAGEMGIESRELNKDAEFAVAVDKVISNCGAVAAQILFDPRKPQQRNSIMKVSRTSRERQQYRINGVAAGKMRSVAPQGADQVPDTVTFREVVSRLERARGGVEVSFKLLATGLDVPETLKRGAAESVEAIEHQLRLLGRVLADLEIVARPTPRKRPKPNRPAGEPIARLQLSQVPRQLKSAVKLIAKNVRELPARSPPTNVHGGPVSSYDLRPTGEELKRARAEIRRIATAVKAILHALSDT